MIRIIGGTLRGRKLEVPSGLKVRPSADRVREALFNMLDHRLHWQDFNVLDLYAGSGALGIEALSRGARFATFVECSKTHEKILMRIFSCVFEHSTKVANRAPLLSASIPNAPLPA